MTRLSLLLAGAWLLAGCASDPKSELVKACVAEGESREDCTCMAESLAENVSPAAFDAIVLSAQGNKEEADAAMSALGLSDAVAVGGAMLKMAAKCGVSGFGE